MQSHGPTGTCWLYNRKAGRGWEQARKHFSGFQRHGGLPLTPGPAGCPAPSRGIPAAFPLNLGPRESSLCLEQLLLCCLCCLCSASLSGLGCKMWGVSSHYVQSTKENGQNTKKKQIPRVCQLPSSRRGSSSGSKACPSAQSLPWPQSTLSSSHLHIPKGHETAADNIKFLIMKPREDKQSLSKNCSVQELLVMTGCRTCS